MFQKLEDVEKRYEDLTKKISDPEIISNQNEWKKLMKEHAGIEPVVEKFREYKKTKKDIEDAKEMLEDKELRELAELEMLEAKERLPKIEEELKYEINFISKNKKFNGVRKWTEKNNNNKNN